MKSIISLLITCLAITYVNGQLYNGGCVITIQEGANLYVADTYIHQSGTINNAGTLSIRDQFNNTSGASPFTMANGTTLFFGESPSIAGSEINFFDLQVLAQVLSISEQPLSIDGQLVLGDALLDLGGNPLLIHDARSDAILANNGGVLANNPTTVILGVGTGMDSYRLPFHNGSEQLMTTISLSSSSSDGANIAVSTFATQADNSPFPMTVDNVNILGQQDGLNVVDRFWHLVPNGFDQSPQGSISLSYSTMDNQDNNIDPANLSVYQWQETGPWDNIMSSVDATQVSSEPLTLDGFFTLASDVFIDSMQGSPIVVYNLDECSAYIETQTFQDYSEFTPQINQLSCATVSASIVERQSPDVNTHSCTPGLNGSTAMCISSSAACSFVDNDPLAVRFSTTLSPDAGQSLALTGINFYEKAPQMFDWIDGDSGTNNYPTMFGLRLLKDGVEVYKNTDIPTSRDWTQQSFNFAGEDFQVTETTVFTFELLGYCHVGNDSNVTAWDLEDIAIFASCGSMSNVSSASAEEGATVTGIISNTFGEVLENVAVSVMSQANVLSSSTSDDAGLFTLSQDNSFDDNAQLDFNFQSLDLDAEVNIVDLIRLYYHLTGRLPITDPAELLAADVNGDNMVNVSDFIEIRSHLLGRESLIENDNRVYVQTSDLDLDNLLIDDSPIMFSQLLASANDIVDITAILRGDIYNTNKIADSRSANTIVVSASANRIFSGQENQVNLNITHEDMDHLSSVWMEIELEPSVTLSDVHSPYFDVDFVVRDQVVTIHGLTHDDATLDNNNQAFISLNIKSDDNIDISEALNIHPSTKIGQGITVTDHFAQVPMIWSLPQASFATADITGEISVYPNPVSSSNPIEVYIPSDVLPGSSIILHDVLGKQVAKIDNPIKGQNRIELNDYAISNSSILIVRFFNGQSSQTKLISIIK